MHKKGLIIALLLLSSSFTYVFAKADITLSGDLQYRIRYHYDMYKNTEGKDSSAAPNLTNRYAWNLKWKIAVNENLLFGIRLSNPSGYETDSITDNITWMENGNYNLLTVPEMYFKWTVGIFSLSAGIIPVKANTVLNLVAYELQEIGDTLHTGYKNVGDNTWSVKTNNSQKGLALGFDLISKEDLSLGMDLVAAMAYNAEGSDKYNVFKYDQVRLILSFPTSLSNGMITLLPLLHARFNAFRSKDTVNTNSDWDEANHSIAGGCDLNIMAMEMLTIKIGAAGGMFNNSCQENDSLDTDNDNISDTPVAQTAPLGVLFKAGATVKPGFGTAIVNFRFGRSRDRKASPALNSDLLFWDIKYCMPIKSLTFIPRLRIWHEFIENSEANKTRLRPELILKASF